MNTTYKFDQKNMLHNCPDILTVSEAAQVLRISDDIMQQLIDSGEIGHIEISSTSLVLKIFLLEYLESLCPLRYTQATEQNVASVAGHLGNQITKFSFVPVSEGEN